MIEIKTYRLKPSNRLKIKVWKEGREWEKIFRYSNTMNSYIKRLEKEGPVIYRTDQEYKELTE